VSRERTCLDGVYCILFPSLCCLLPCRPTATSRCGDRSRFGDANGVIHTSLRATPQATGRQATPSERCKRDSYLVAGGCFDVRSGTAPGVCHRTPSSQRKTSKGRSDN